MVTVTVTVLRYFNIQKMPFAGLMHKRSADIAQKVLLSTVKYRKAFLAFPASHLPSFLKNRIRRIRVFRKMVRLIARENHIICSIVSSIIRS